MTPKISNCKRCNKVFKMTYSPYCPNCYQVSVSRFSNIYRFVQEHPHMTLQDVARHCNVPVKEMEELFFEGHLGTAAQHIIYHCQRCSRPISAAFRTGRFCPQCTERVETDARLYENKQTEVVEDVPPAESVTSQAVKRRKQAELEHMEEKIDEARVILAEEKRTAETAAEETKTPEPRNFGFKRSP